MNETNLFIKKLT